MDRRKYIGASEAAAICGLDPYKTAMDVFLEKTGRVDPFNGNEATAAGLRLEHSVIEWAKEKLGAIACNEQLRREHPERPWMMARLDAGMINRDGVRVMVEAKTSGIVGVTPKDWTEYEYPEGYKVQVHHQWAVSNGEFKEAYLAALIGGQGFRLYRVEIEPDLIACIMEVLDVFWHDHVLKDVPPDNSKPSLEVAKRLKRMPNKSVPISWELVSDFERAKKIVSESEKDRDECQAALLAALGDAEEGVAEGLGRVTYYEQTRKAYSVQETKFRVLRTRIK
jgi:putative phage-type endonuclease